MTRLELLKIAKPILFNTEMVRAIQDGRKTVTRRAVKSKKFDVSCADFVEMSTDPYETRVDRNGDTYPHQIKGLYATFEYCGDFLMVKSPFKVGDYLYVRETFCAFCSDHIIDGAKYAYKADSTPESERVRKEFGYKWKPSIHMPKEAARIFLRVTDVRVERLQDITEEQAKAEGIDVTGKTLSARCIFKYHLWNSTVKKSELSIYGWDANPWVWVIEFERVEVE